MGEGGVGGAWAWLGLGSGVLGLGWVREVRWGLERKEREERDQRGRGRGRGREIEEREIKEKERERREIKKEERERGGREERVCGSHNTTSTFNCHMSYLIANLTVLSQQRLK